jgi:sarcosine oxidase, subunit gamma
MAEAVKTFDRHVTLSRVKCAVFRVQSWSLSNDKAQRSQLAGLQLPTRIGEIVGHPTRILRLGPREWQVISEESAWKSLNQSLEVGCHQQDLELTDLTSATSVFRIEGKASRELLSKGCGVDLHPREFAGGHGARTRFAAVDVVIECLNQASCFELHVSSSFTDYLHMWLSEAALEFGAG